MWRATTPFLHCNENYQQYPAAALPGARARDKYAMMFVVMPYRARRLAAAWPVHGSVSG